MEDERTGGGDAFEPTPLSDIHGPERKPFDELIPDAAEVAPAAEGEPPADPPRESPVEPAGGDPEPDPEPAPAPAPEPAPEPAAQPQLTPEAIGAAVAAAMRAQREEEAARNQPREDPPDWDVDPASAAAYHQREANAAQLKMRLDMSHQIAQDTIPTYQEVMGANNEHWDAYLSANPHVWQQVAQAPHPAKVAHDLLKREQMLQRISEAGGLESYEKKAVERFLSAYAPKQEPASAQGRQAPQQPGRQAENPPENPPGNPPAGDDPNAPAFSQPGIPKMMGDDRSAAPRGEEGFKGPIPLEELDRQRPGGKLRRIA